MSSMSRLQLQQRDIELFLRLSKVPLLTLALITITIFDGHSEAARKRVQRLKSKGYLSVATIAVAGQRAYTLTQKSFSVLKQTALVPASTPWEPTRREALRSHPHLLHLMNVIEFGAAVEEAVKAPGLGEWRFDFTPEPRAYEFTVPRDSGYGAPGVRVKPDGVLQLVNIATLKTQMLFVEVDLGTEPLQTILNKARSYVRYYRSGTYARDQGGSRSDYRRHPFRVLMIFQTAERRNNVIEVLLRNTPPISGQVWLTTHKEARVDPLGEIWVRPRDYRRATEGTPFDSRGATTPKYKRQPGREQFIEQNIRKASIVQ